MITQAVRRGAAVMMTVLACATPAVAADLLYDVTMFTMTGMTDPPLGFTAPLTPHVGQVTITDRGPQPDGGVRWQESAGGTVSLGGLSVADQPYPEASPLCGTLARIGVVSGATPFYAETVAVQGEVNFAWIAGPDGDPYAFFCLAQTVGYGTPQVTESLAFGRRVVVPMKPGKGRR